MDEGPTIHPIDAKLCHLLNGELSVGAIAQRVGLSQSALSQHLAKLRQLDIVATRRERQTIYYSCNGDALRVLLVSLDNTFGHANGRTAPFSGREVRHPTGS